MNKNILLALLLGFVLTTPILAHDDTPMTLPPAAYSQMVSGKKLDKVWVDPSFDKSKGFKVAPVLYKAELRVGEAMDSLNKALGTLANPDSPYTLKVAIVKVTTKTFNFMGGVQIEGRVLDQDDKVMATFISKERAGSFGSIKDDYTNACDKLASAIAKDLQ